MPLPDLDFTKVAGFEPTGGLLPVVVQDASSFDVIRICFLNPQGVEILLERHVLTPFVPSTKGFEEAGVHAVAAFVNCNDDSLLCQAQVSEEPGLTTLVGASDVSTSALQRYANAGPLIPAIAADHSSREVLMLGFQNRAALEETLATGYMTYFSRSSRDFMRHGAKSGCSQQVLHTLVTAQRDALVFRVVQVGNVCHTGHRGCFFRCLFRPNGRRRASVPQSIGPQRKGEP